MARKLDDAAYLNFNGGVRRDVGDYVRQKNQLKNCQNFDIDNAGRLIRRPGFYQFGTTLSGTLKHAITYINGTSSTLDSSFLVFDSGANANCYRLLTTTLASTINTGDTTASVVENTGFAAATSTFEVDGDLITYTAVPSATSFTITASTILKAHYAGASVNQWSTAVASGVDSRSGLYSASLNGLMFLGGIATAASTTDGSSFTGRTLNGSAMFLTVYRDRLFGVGDGAAGANSDANRVAFSNAGTGITWTTSDFFDVEDSRGEPVTGLKVLSDRLIIFKQNSTFYYNENVLKQSLSSVGAYNHESVQEIDGRLYTFCPSGVFVTNGSSAIKISEPIEEILKLFRPSYDTTQQRVINNCFSGKYDKKYFLYLDILYSPNNDNRLETNRGVTLVYDTQLKSWAMYRGINGTNTTSFTSFLSTPSFKSGNITASGLKYWQGIESMFGTAGADSRLYRFFENSYVGTDSGVNPRGTFVTADAIADTVGLSISALAETGFQHLGSPSWWKRFGYIRVLMEEGECAIQYQLDKGTSITDWISLGDFTGMNQRKKLSQFNGQNEGYRINIRISSNQLHTISKINGFILEDTEAITKQDHAEVQ